MEILRKADIKAKINVLFGTNYPSYLDFLVENARKESPQNYKYSIFLSHSHHDAELVKKIVLILKNIGVEVYVDWMDDSMPASTCGITAAKIKQKIKQNNKFIFLATNISIDSKWCNWEIGYGDADKFQDDDIAVFPVKENYSEWKGNEYLQLYPSIKRSNDTLYIVYPNGKEILLTEWLLK